MISEARREFLSRWIPYGIDLLTRAEAHGLDWRNIRMEQLDAHIIFAEEWARPEEDKPNPFINQPLKGEYNG